MKYIGILVVAMALTAGTAGQDAKKVNASLQGTWAVGTINGKSLDGGPSLLLSFEGDKYFQTMDGTVNERGWYKIDTSKKPMTIDLIITEGDDAGKTQLGVFEVTGDKLRANLNIPGSTQRLPDFTIAEAGIMFEAVKRAKL